MTNDFLASIKDKQLVLRGSGQEAEQFLLQWNNYYHLIIKYIDKSFADIESVMDNNPQKIGKNFHDIKIVKPAESYEENLFFIVAIYKRKEIFSELLNLGYKENIDFQYHDLFLKKVRFDLSEKIKNILKKLFDDGIIKTSASELENESLYSQSLIYKKIEQSNLYENEKNLLLELLLENIIKNWLKEKDDKKRIINLTDYFPLADIIAALCTICENNIEELEPLYQDDIHKNKISKKIQTIGIYSPKFANGGAERVLSILLPIFIELQYNIILFTDFFEEEEYNLPKEVKRIVIKNQHLFNFKIRLKEYENYIKKYNIDIIFINCFSDSLKYFYEPLFFKLLNIPVISEAHTVFFRFIKRQSPWLNKWQQIYKVMNKIIVLSRIDKLYWEALFCNAKYIPNPIENGKELWNLPIKFNKRNGKSILWIGRASDKMKNLSDTVLIMNEVIKQIPDAMLKIVGSTKGTEDFFILIKKYHLENNIKLLGYYSNLDTFYEEADVMIMTSDYEGFPMIMTEAKLHGVPIIMYELPYLELVRDRRGIFEVSPRDTKATANAIVKILSDDKLRHRMSIESKRSLYPFVFYDIKGAWKEVFEEI